MAIMPGYVSKDGDGVVNKIILPHEIIDKQLKEVGVDGYIDPTTGLLLPRSEESHRIITQRLLAPRQIHPRNNTETKTRGTQG